MAIKHFPVVRFTSRGREYEVDERLITTIDKHRSTTTRSRIILHHAGTWTSRTLPRNAWHGNRI